MDNDPERSILEIKHLLSRLNPRGAGGGHKDRVRVLSRFRNYVAGAGAQKKGQKVTTPPFYDDDIPLLFLGSSSPVNLYDEEQYGDITSYYGLLAACSTASTDHKQKGKGLLKRSARNAMALVKYLVCEHVDLLNGEMVNSGIDAKTGLPELNSFAYTFCSFSASQLKLANFDAHLSHHEGDVRAGARGDACEVLVLLFTRHFDPNSNTNDANAKGKAGSPTLRIEDVLTTPEARKAFDNWMVQNVSKDVQNIIKKNQNQTENVPTQIVPQNDGKSNDNDNNASKNPFGEDIEVDLDDVFKIDKSRKVIEAEASQDRQQRLEKIGIKLDVVGQEETNDAPVTSWENSALAKKQVQLSVAEGVASTEVTDRAEDSKWSKQIQERQMMIGRDPMGIRPDTFDLKTLKDREVEILTACIEDIEEEIRETGDTEKPFDESKRKKRDKYAYSVEQLVSLEAQRSALEAILIGDTEDLDDEEGEEKRQSAQDLSILPSSSNFDPLLFLTLVHRNASYDQMKESIEKLENKTDDQTQRIQQLIRENFQLFIRCADGIDLFSDKAGRSRKNTPGVNDWLNRLESLAQSTSDNAKKSFKPLLDNTNEVRKVQSALAVLQRVGPLLQVPSLMRQHIENGRFSAAVSTYRKALVIDDNSKIKLLRHVKLKAAEAARDARVDLETRLADPNLPVHTILDSIKSLSELIELDIPSPKFKSESSEEVKTNGSDGKYVVGDVTVDVRAHQPSLSCLLLQAAHFTKLVSEAVEKTESISKRIYNGEPLLSITAENDDYNVDDETVLLTSKSTDSKSSDKRERIRWKYDVLESRVLATIRIVAMARTWLPRLLRIAEAARQSEMRLAARAMRRIRRGGADDVDLDLTAFEVFITIICPSITLLVEHCAFCSLGSDEGQNTKATYGMNGVDEKLQKLVLSPLPAAQSSKCASELAQLAAVVQTVANSAISLRPNEHDYGFGPDRVSKASHYQRAAMETSLEKIVTIMEETVVIIERRKCIYAFDQCNRSCSMRASGSGIFDCDSIISCVQKLSEELTRPENCAAEIEKGCELVVRRCCEGLASYVRDRGDSARLRAVSECASALNESIVHLVREVSDLTTQESPHLEEALVDDVISLENKMFDEFLVSIRNNMSTYTKLGPMTTFEEEDEFIAERQKSEAPFPAYLSASLLAIVRCRAQVERTLGLNTIRKDQSPATYQFLALSTAADSVVYGTCIEISDRMSRMRGSQADQYLTELQFLLNTLNKFLGDDVLKEAEDCKRELLSKIGGSQGQGPDGLGAIERLERLGRIYVMCLGD